MHAKVRPLFKEFWDVLNEGNSKGLNYATLRKITDLLPKRLPEASVRSLLSAVSSNQVVADVETFYVLMENVQKEAKLSRVEEIIHAYLVPIVRRWLTKRLPLDTSEMKSLLEDPNANARESKSLWNTYKERADEVHPLVVGLLGAGTSFQLVYNSLTSVPAKKSQTVAPVKSVTDQKNQNGVSECTLATKLETPKLSSAAAGESREGEETTVKVNSLPGKGIERTISRVDSRDCASDVSVETADTLHNSKDAQDSTSSNQKSSDSCNDATSHPTKSEPEKLVVEVNSRDEHHDPAVALSNAGGNRLDTTSRNRSQSILSDSHQSARDSSSVITPLQSFGPGAPSPKPLDNFSITSNCLPRSRKLPTFDLFDTSFTQNISLRDGNAENFATNVSPTNFSVASSNLPGKPSNAFKIQRLLNLRDANPNARGRATSLVSPHNIRKEESLSALRKISNNLSININNEKCKSAEEVKYDAFEGCLASPSRNAITSPDDPSISPIVNASKRKVESEKIRLKKEVQMDLMALYQKGQQLDALRREVYSLRREALNEAQREREEAQRVVEPTLETLPSNRDELQQYLAVSRTALTSKFKEADCLRASQLLEHEEERVKSRIKEEAHLLQLLKEYEKLKPGGTASKKLHRRERKLKKRELAMQKTLQLQESELGLLSARTPIVTLLAEGEKRSSVTASPKSRVSCSIFDDMEHSWALPAHNHGKSKKKVSESHFVRNATDAVLSSINPRIAQLNTPHQLLDPACVTSFSSYSPTYSGGNIVVPSHPSEAASTLSRGDKAAYNPMQVCIQAVGPRDTALDARMTHQTPNTSVSTDQIRKDVCHILRKKTVPPEFSSMDGVHNFVVGDLKSPSVAVPNMTTHGDAHSAVQNDPWRRTHKYLHSFEHVTSKAAQISTQNPYGYLQYLSSHNKSAASGNPAEGHLSGHL